MSLYEQSSRQAQSIYELLAVLRRRLKTVAIELENPSRISHCISALSDAEHHLGIFIEEQKKP